MVQEYLFIDQKGRAEIEGYTLENGKVEITDIENSDHWIATFSVVGENINTSCLPMCWRR